MADKEEKAEIQAAPGKTNVFLAWSGPQSRKIAKVLREYLPLMINAIEPYMSEEDVEKGTIWTSEIAGQLENTDCGILCITPENCQSQWIHFEAGALLKRVDKSRVCPFLIGMKESELTGPLASLFQTTKYDKDDFLRLLKTLNKACGLMGISDAQLERAFGTYKADIFEELDAIREELERSHESPAPENTAEKTVAITPEQTEELIVRLREQGRQLSEIQSAISKTGGHQLLRPKAPTPTMVEREETYRNELVITEAALGPDHPELALGLADLAGLLCDMNRFDEAEPIYRKALKIFEESLGINDTKTEFVRKNLRWLARRKKR